MLTKENLKIITDKSPIKIKKWMLIPIGIAILLLIGFSIFFFPSANVEVKMTSREINKTFDVKANSQNTSVNVMRNIIPATLLDVTDSSSSSISTTGKKDFGNNATGTVVVYNSTTTTINIPAGTTFITSDSNAHAFTSQEAISVPGSSSAPQSQTVNLKAANFGSQYNVAISTPFKIKLDSIPNQGIITSASTPFQGGTSDVAQIVTQQDQDNLLKSLTEQLTRKETDALSAKITDEVHVVKDSLKSEVITKQFDKGVGDRETLLNLLLGIKVSQIAYKDSDIKTYTEKFLTKDLRKDETLKNVKFSSTINSFDGATGDVNITIKATGSAIPSLDSSTIANNIKMKSFSSSKSYIKTFNGVTDVTINVTPFWYNIFQFMPFKNNNISINVITK